MTPSTKHGNTCPGCSRNVASEAALATLDALEAVVQPIDAELYQPLQQAALARIGERDPDD